MVLSDDYFKVEAEDIQWIESVLTVLGGKVVYAGQSLSKTIRRYHQLHQHGHQ